LPTLPHAAMSDDEQEALPELEEKWKGKVEELFKMYDFDATGMIPLERLNATSMSVGAANINVLSTLAQMDYNGDGYVEMGEWEMYFATCTSVLADDEVEEVMNALSAAASDLSTIYQCTRAAEAAEPDETSTEEAADIIASLGNLEGEQKQLVLDLFNKWDFNGNGAIEIAVLSSTGVSVGPRMTKVFAEFEKMDVDGDQKVSLDEMLLYFGVVSQMMTPEQFHSTVEEMSAVAGQELSIERLVKLAEEAQMLDGEDEETEPPPALSDERKDLVLAYFRLYQPHDEPIDIGAISEDGKVETGPAKHNVLEYLKAMDYNGDGKIEVGEMLEYFTFVGQELNDDEFALIIEECTDSAMASKMLSMAGDM